MKVISTTQTHAAGEQPTQVQFLTDDYAHFSHSRHSVLPQQDKESRPKHGSEGISVARKNKIPEARNESGPDRWTLLIPGY
jgi:hypothetical protein